MNSSRVPNHFFSRVAAPIPVRLVFPAEALDCRSFLENYRETLAFGDQSLDQQYQLITFLHPGIKNGRIESLEQPLRDAGLPYNLHQASRTDCMEPSRTLLWRPAPLIPFHPRLAPLWIHHRPATTANPFLDIDVRRACECLVYGQQTLELPRHFLSQSELNHSEPRVGY